MFYHWLLPEESAEPAPQVIRVLGEKGERYETVYSDDSLAALKQNPAIREAMLARQAALRKEALELARQLREAGKEPLVAYEEAWTHVYSRNWLSRGVLDGSCKLEDMLNRMASEGEEQELTEDERQWLLEALLEDDDRLESEAGQELLRRLAAQLRKMGYGRAEYSQGANDEIMMHFSAALQYQSDSMRAYREALFNTHRNRVMTHEITGFRAPWGLGMGGGAYYRQAPQQVQTTEGSGNTQPPAQTAVTFGSGQQFTAPGLNELPDVNTDFLARAPELPDKKKELEDEEEEKDSVQPEETDADSETAAPAMLSMRSFSMRSMAYASRSAGAAENAEIPDSPVQDGGVQLAPGESIDVGANRVTGGTSGGSLENVQMLVTGELVRPVTGDSVTVHNLITSADGTNPGILTDVTLYAGTSTEYVTLHNIAFAGQSALTGYITFEKTQTTGDMSVAAGGTLTLENLTFDLRGLSMGDKTLIVVEDGGNLVNWDAVNVHFVYSGVKVNSAAVDFSKGPGVIGFSWDHDDDLFWNGAADNMWNIGSENWSSTEGGTESEVFTALSNVYFGEGGAEDREISVTQDMVVANLGVTDGGYSFKGARVAVLRDATFEHKEGAVTFNNQLVVQGGLQAEEGSGSVALLGGATIVENAVFRNLTTTIAGDMTVGGKLTVLSGDAATAGSLTISGNVTAQEMEFAVSAGAASDSNPDYNKHLVNVSGNLTARDKGSITIGGTAAQYYTGTVTAGNLTVNTKEHDVYFSYLQVGKLTVEEGSTVHVRSSSDAVHVSSSVFPEVDLYGTLALDAPGVTYNDSHKVNVMSDAARLVFGEGCTIADLQIFGKQDNTGSSSYTDVDIEVNSRSATVTEMRDLGTLKVETGTLTVKNAGGAVHGELFLNNGKLQLGENTNDIMAAGSGAVRLENGGILDIGKSSQTLSANNQVFLSGASTITSEADGGLSLGDGIIINYEDSGNSIETKLTAEKNFTLNSTLAGSSLEISGHISGSGEMELTGSGSVVLSSANTDFSGTVTVQKSSTLTLQNTDALSNAGVVLNEGATLALDAPDTVTLKALTFSTGSTLDISSIVGTDGLSAQDAVLQVGTSNIGSNALTLNVHFADTLDTMTTYNIMSGLSSGNGLSLNVEHNGVKLDDSQYTLGVNNGVLYIYTMMGNVWDGGGSKIWSATGEFENWSEEKYNEDKDLGYTAAIFRDLIQTTEKVTVQGPVSPGDIYFTAGKTQYELVSNGSDGWLAAGTQIHKIGKADVSLDLAGNASADNALGDVNVRVGSLILESDLAVKGTVSVEKSAQLKVQGGSDGLNMVNEKGEVTYTASSVAPGVFASLSGVTMDAAGIRGTADALGSAENLLVQGKTQLSYLKLTNLGTEGNVTLTNVTLMGTGSHALENVTIGQGVVVDASGVYTLSGDITFDSTLTNKGIITLDKVTSIEIGKLQHTPTFDAESGRVQYDYQLIKSEGNGSVTEHTHTSSQFSINGVNLDGGLIVDVNIDGSRHGALTLTVDNGNVAIPMWDEDWGKTEKAPAFTRIYAGTDADNVELAAGIKDVPGIEDVPDYYHYETIVNEANASRVNSGRAIAVTLTPNASGELVVGGQIEWGGSVAPDHEVWIYDRSEFRNIIGGQGRWADTPQSADTHILVNSTFAKDPDAYVRSNPKVKISDRTLWAKQFIIGGSRWGEQGASWSNLVAESYVTVLDGEIYTIFGGSCGAIYTETGWGTSPNYEYAHQNGTSHVFIKGGRIGEIFAAGMYSTHIGTQVVDGRENKRAVELVLTGGTLGGHHLRVFGGGERGKVYGDIYIRMEGDANIESQLVGGSNVGTVYGDIEMDLISGYAFRVDAAGIGWGNVEEGIAHIDGDVQVNLYRAGTSSSTSPFRLGTVADIDPASRLIGGIYGGKETTNYVDITKPGAEIMLHFAESGRYELASIGSEGYETSAQSVVVTGFDRFKLENNAHVVLGLGLFDMDMDDPNDSINPEALVISGEGVVEVIGHGIKYYVPIEDEYGNVKPEKEERDERNLGRDILLKDSATLKISTSVIGLTGSEDDRTITVTDGTTIDFSGVPGETGYTGDSDFAGLGFNVVIAGHGVDGKGAIYKGKNDDSWYPAAETFSSRTQRIILPNVELTSSASVKVVAGETLLMNNASEQEGGTYAQGTAHLGLNKHTFTKLGAGDFIARSVKITPGTILVQQGGFGFDLTDDASQTDMVLAADGELKLNASGLKTGGATNLTLRSLSGAGAVKLNGSTLTLHTDADSPYYYGEYMTDEYRNDAQDYDQFSETTGFGYAVFSGMISDAKGGGKLVKTGTGVHYISGSSSTYTGGTQLQKGRLYLLGTSEASTFTKDTSKTAAGVVGRGTIEWDSAANAELYLGHGARIYNKGTTDAQGGFMTIGVEGVPNAVLADFVVTQSGGGKTVTMGGVEYVEIDTHNLKSIDVAAVYADGTAYAAGTDIDRNKMLLVKMSDWATAKDSPVSGFSATGYNEATYSGILADYSSSVAAGLRKVGVGTLELDQRNSYTGGTLVEAGTPRLRGWGTVGYGEVQVGEGASLMLAYNGGYDVDKTATKDDETIRLSNNMTLSGAGDEQWTIQLEEDESQAASGATHSATDGLTAALISAVGRSVTFTLSGNIQGDGGVLHSGEGTLVLCGDSSYTGGTVITRGVVDVQSATGLGATAEGNSAVKLGKDADLHVTVKSGSGGGRLVTTLATVGDEILGDVSIAGSKYTERVLHMADNGYNAATTTLGEKGTFLLCGKPIDGQGISSHSGLLTGSGTVVVSDALGSGTTAAFDTIKDYTGDFWVEGHKSSIHVDNGSYSEGSIQVAGQQASVQIGGNVSIVAGESLQLRSMGKVPTQNDTPGMGTGAVLVSKGEVSVAADAVLSVRRGETYYSYNLSDLEKAVSVTPTEIALPEEISDSDYHKLGEDKDIPDYTGCFESRLAVNQQAVAGVKADVGLTLAGGCTYETSRGHLSLMGGSLKLDTLENNQLTFNTTLDYTWLNEANDAQLVLFSDVSSVTFVYDNVTATTDSGVYYTRADRYLTGNDYIDSQTMLVYDSNVGVVYLQIKTPEPTTTTLGLVALAALAARRRRKRD